MLYGCNRPSAADSQKGGNVRGKAKHSRKGTYLIWTSSKGDSFEWQREEARGGKYRSEIFNLSHLVAHFHQLLTFSSTPKNIFLANLTKKNRYCFDSLTPDCCCCVGCCHFFLVNLRGKRSVPLTE